MGKTRNTDTHQEEVNKIIKILLQRMGPGWMGIWTACIEFRKMLSLDDAAAYLETDKKDYRSALAVIFIAVFLISVKLVLKYESE